MKLFFAESTDEELEGMLVRKHEWESTTKKASNRYLKHSFRSNEQSYNLYPIEQCKVCVKSSYLKVHDLNDYVLTLAPSLLLVFLEGKFNEDKI